MTPYYADDAVTIYHGDYLVQMFCPPGGTVLDPFMGSGTTLRAAIDCDRKAIGIEIEKKWCADTVERCAQQGLGLSA